MSLSKGWFGHLPLLQNDQVTKVTALESEERA